MLKIFLFCFKQISKCDTCFYIPFLRVFKNIVFRSVVFSQNKAMGYFRFFIHNANFLPALYPTLRIKKNVFFTKNL